MNTIDALLWLAAGAIYLAGVVTGAGLLLGWSLMRSRSADAAWEVRRGN